MTRTNRAACLLCLTGTLSSCCKRLASSSLMGALLFSCRRCFIALSMALTPSASSGTPLQEPASLDLPLFDVVHFKHRACCFRAPPPPRAPASRPAPRISFKAKKDYGRHRKLRNHAPQLPLSCEARGGERKPGQNTDRYHPCLSVGNALNASAANRTRVTSMATMYSTTRPLMQLLRKGG